MTTKKKATSFRLSDEALAQLKDLAERKKISQAEAVEMALREMTVSTPEQLKQQKQAFDRAYAAFAEDNGYEIIVSGKIDYLSARHIYKSGYREGWWHYQARHYLDDLTYRDRLMDHLEPAIYKRYLKDKRDKLHHRKPDNSEHFPTLDERRKQHKELIREAKKLGLRLPEMPAELSYNLLTAISFTYEQWINERKTKK